MTQTMRDTNGYDIWLEYDGTGYGFVLEDVPEDQGGGLMYRAGVVQPLVDQRHSGNMSYEALPTYLTNPIQFETWHGGSGHEDAGVNKQSNRNDSYSYSQGVDASEGSRLILSPEIQSVAAVSAEITHIKYLPSFGLMALAGRYVYQWDTGTAAWVQKKDMGAGHTATDIIEWANDVATYCIVAFLDDDYSYTTDLTTWTEENVHVKKFAVRGTSSDVPVLWGILSDGQIQNTVAIAAASWSLQDRIGNTSTTVNSLWVQAGDLFIGKADGLYRFDGTTVTEAWVNRDFPDENAFTQHTTYVDGHVYTNWYGRILQIQASSTDTLIAPVFKPRHEEVTGQITAIGGSEEHLYFALKNSAGNTYIMKMDPEDIHDDKFADEGNGHPTAHTFMYRGANDCAALQFSPIGEQHASNPTLAIHSNASDAEYVILARPGLRPWEDSNYKFDTNGGFLIGPWSDGGAQAYTKFINGARLVAEGGLTADINAILAYACDGDDTSYTNVITASEDGLSTATISTAVECTRIQYKITLDTNTDETSPVINGLIFDTTPNPPRRQAWTMGVRIGTNFRRRDGVQVKEAFTTLRDHLLNAVEEKVTFTDVDGTQYTVKVSDARIVALKYVSSKGGRRPGLEATMRLSIAEIVELESAIGSPFIYGSSILGGGDVWV